MKYTPNAENLHPCKRTVLRFFARQAYYFILLTYNAVQICWYISWAIGILENRSSMIVKLDGKMHVYLSPVLRE